MSTEQDRVVAFLRSHAQYESSEAAKNVLLEKARQIAAGDHMVDSFPRVVAMSSYDLTLEPDGATAQFPAGTQVCFRSGSTERCGIATVHHADDFGHVYFDRPITTQIPAICLGDRIFKYDVPCTRCRCKACEVKETK